MNSCEIFMEHRLEGGPFSVTMANVEYDPGQGTNIYILIYI